MRDRAQDGLIALAARRHRDVRHLKGGQRLGLTPPALRRILTLMSDESPKRLIVVGDRVLITPEEGEERTNVGLYLPPTAVESRQVQGGRIVATGPGTPMTEPASMDDEPWKIHGPEVKYLPMQAVVGDYALFFRKAAVEITFEGKKYLVAPQAAILVLVREVPADEPEE